MVVPDDIPWFIDAGYAFRLICKKNGVECRLQYLGQDDNVTPDQLFQQYSQPQIVHTHARCRQQDSYLHYRVEENNSNNSTSRYVYQEPLHSCCRTSMYPLMVRKMLDLNLCETCADELADLTVRQLDTNDSGGGGNSSCFFEPSGRDIAPFLSRAHELQRIRNQSDVLFNQETIRDVLFNQEYPFRTCKRNSNQRLKKSRGF